MLYNFEVRYEKFAANMQKLITDIIYIWLYMMESNAVCNLYVSNMQYIPEMIRYLYELLLIP